VLLGLAFVPLFWTAATFSRLSLERTERTSALHLGQAVGRAVAEGQLTPELIPPIVGLQFIRSDGTVLSLGTVPPRAHSTPLPEAGIVLVTGSQRILWSSSRGHEGLAHVGVVINDPKTDHQSFVGLLALYMGILGVGLLFALYLALTFLIVRPLDELGRATQRVTVGTRPIQLPTLPARELVTLGNSFQVMTERLLSEERALQRRIAEINEANSRLKQAQENLLRSERLASVGRLAAGLAHELGNPISAMMGLEELVLQGGLSRDEERDFLQRIARETERVHRILRDLLDFARPTTKPNHEDPQPGDLRQTIDETLALVLPQRAFRELSIVIELSDRLPLVTLARARLMQVLLNLLLNAADALPATGTIRIAASQRSDDSVELSVADDGPGVPTEIRETLFEPFVTTKEVGKGTGLGLSVCRGLVEGAGGSITLDDEYQTGARFVIVLPIAKPSAE
jgi:signal transduction histidine kinase